jgi:hypothetical protein
MAEHPLTEGEQPTEALMIYLSAGSAVTYAALFSNRQQRAGS